MTVTEALRKRRSIKSYDPDFQISPEEISEFLKICLETPSSFNLQHWRIAVVTDQAQKDALCAASWGQRQVADASFVLFIAGDVRAHETAERYWEGAPDGVQEKMAGLIRGFYANPQLQRDEVIRSCSLLGMSLMLAATERGWATCPMIGYDENKVKDILGIPPRWIPALMITVGRGIKDAYAKTGQLDYSETVFYNSFNQD